MTCRLELTETVVEYLELRALDDLTLEAEVAADLATPESPLSLPATVWREVDFAVEGLVKPLTGRPRELSLADVSKGDSL